MMTAELNSRLSVTLDGLLDAIASGDPIALDVARDYALDHLGADTPEMATARLIDVAADRGMDTLRSIWKILWSWELPADAQLVSTGHIYPDCGDFFVVAGTGARVVSRSQQGGSVEVVGTAQFFSRLQQNGFVNASHTSRVLSSYQRGGTITACHKAQVRSYAQQDGSLFALDRSHIISQACRGGFNSVAGQDAILEEIP
jgi:hypothetical protein